MKKRAGTVRPRPWSRLLVVAGEKGGNRTAWPVFYKPERLGPLRIEHLQVVETAVDLSLTAKVAETPNHVIAVCGECGRRRDKGLIR